MTRLRLGIDAHAIGTKAGGNETYMRELLAALREHPAADVDAVAYVSPAVEADPEAVAGFQTFPLGLPWSWVRVPILLPLAAQHTRADLLHVQYAAPPYCPCPYVVSIHDIVWKHHPDLLRPTTRYRLAALTPPTLRRAARVFALTEAVKQDIADSYRVPLDRIDVVAPGVAPLFRPIADGPDRQAVLGQYGVQPPYVLYVGALQPRKNLTRLAAAFARLAAQGFPHSLVVAGPRIWMYRQVLAELEPIGLGDRLRFIGYVDRPHLPHLLSAADAFAYVSIYEGFGLPVLEALACAAPVLASTDPAIREASRDAAVHCDPLDVDAIEQGLRRILTDETLRTQLRDAGPARAARYTRQAMAEAALAGYRAALA
ncbi:MAG: glycosyltransferase family 4 protein [Candidatus Hydrogenedentes bacterium]|nr:glycosyltransferase family 4 protein [Candidatus Hydrogenedentota bacterium]